MDKFFEKYKESVERDRQLPFNESDWDKLQAKMDSNIRVIPLPWYFWPLITSCVMFAAFAFYTLKSNFTPSQNLNTIDTVNIEQLTRDTIYIENKVYLYKYLNRNHANNRSTESNKDNYEQYENVNDSLRNVLKNIVVRNQDLENKLTTYQNPINTTVTEITLSENQIKSNAELLSQNNASSKTQLPTPNDLILPDIPIAVSLPITIDTLNNWQKFIQSFTPIGLTAGLQSGLPLVLANNTVNKPGFMIGMRLNILLKSKIELRAGISYTQPFFESFIMDSRLGVPVEKAPQNDFKFYKAEALLSSIQMDLGLHYRLLNSRISPAIGIGTGFMTPLASKLSYDFVQGVIEYPIDKAYKPEIKNPFSLQLMGSLDYNINARWSWTLQSVWHRKLHKNNLLANRFDLLTGINFRLY